MYDLYTISMWLYIYRFETILYIILWQGENKKVLICNIDDEITKYVVAPKSTKLCTWTQIFNLTKVFNQLINGMWWFNMVTFGTIN